MRITFPLGAPLGVGLIQKDGKVVVDLVQPTSAAAAVPVGATIKEINGASCEGKGMKEVMAMIVARVARRPGGANRSRREAYE